VAENKVVFEVRATSSGFEVVQKQQKQLASAVDKTNTKTQELDKTQEKNYGRQKQGLIQTANSTKNFAKLSQTIGSGSSGLVGAYATLAANIFAASAAFNALRQAAAFDQLTAGFTFMANEAGRTTGIVVERLKEISGNALSTREALQGASLALSAGFQSDDLEKLTKVARGASLALGRNLNDAFDRLTRGAIKLEPEILDELGIMVRLDDAVETYAAKLGKSANSLTQFQRQQAFVNAINDQGLKKFGDIADAVETNPYDRLAAAFEDLTKNGLNLLNKVLTPFISILGGSSTALTGGLILFGSTIVTQMIPALGNMSKKAAENADALKQIAIEAKESSDQVIIGTRDQVLGLDKSSKSFRKFAGLLKQGEVDQTEVQKQLLLAQKRLDRAKDVAKNEDKEYSDAVVKNAKERINKVKEEILLLNQLKKAKGGQAQAIADVGAAETASDIAGKESAGLIAISGAGPLAGFKEAKKQFKEFRETTDLTKEKFTGLFKSFSSFAPVARTAGVAVRFFGTAFLNAIPFIGQAVFAIGLLIQAFGALKERISPTIKELENFKTIIDTVPEKLDQLTEKNAKADSQGARSINRIKVQAGLLSDLAANAKGAAVSVDDLTAAEAKRQTEYNERTGKLSGIARDPVDVEAIRKTFQEKSDKAIQQGLRDLFKEQGDEAKLLQEEILKAADQFSKEKGFIVSIDESGKTAATASVIANILGIAAQNTGDINGNLDSLEKQLISSERTFAKFFQTSKGKTPFDDTAEEFVNLDLTLKALKDRPDEVKKKLEGLGKQAERFGITSANAGTRIEELATLFTDLRNKSNTLQDELKTLTNTQKALSQFASIDASATRALLESQNLSAQKQKELYELELQTLDANSKDKEVIAKIADLNAKITTQTNLIKSNAEITAQSNLITAQNAQKILQVEQEKTKLTSDRLKAEARIAKFQRSGTTKLSAIEEFEFKQKFLDDEKTAVADRIKKEEAIIDAQYALLEAQLTASVAKGEIDKTIAENILTSQNSLNTAIKSRNTETIKAAETAAKINPLENFESAVQGGDFLTILQAFEKLDEKTQGLPQKFSVANAALQPFITSLKELGAAGEVIGLLSQTMLTLVDTFLKFDETTKEIGKGFGADAFAEGGIFAGIGKEKLASVIGGLQAVGAVLGGFSQILAADARRRTEEINRQIEQEKRLDGKSEASLAKIKAMEAKKEAIARKAFERQKKMQIAQTIIATATAIMQTAASNLGAPWAYALMGAIGAMGAAQIAIIRKQTYQGEGGGDSSAMGTALTIGGRSNNVDVARGATSGELAYLRGGRTTGENLGGAGSSFPGSAMGRRGYADGAMLVGERGPELVAPSGQVDVIPNYALGGGSTNVNFTINAVDGQSVQNMLYTQRGNIIGMIREAANANGEGFLESVDPAVYGGNG